MTRAALLLLAACGGAVAATSDAPAPAALEEGTVTPSPVYDASTRSLEGSAAHDASAITDAGAVLEADADARDAEIEARSCTNAGPLVGSCATNQATVCVLHFTGDAAELAASCEDRSTVNGHWFAGQECGRLETPIVRCDLCTVTELDYPTFGEDAAAGGLEAARAACINRGGVP